MKGREGCRCQKTVPSDMSPAMYPCWYDGGSAGSCVSGFEGVSGDGVDGRGVRLAMATFRSGSEREIRVQRYAFLENNCAIARPMPRLPPVMRTCRGRCAMVVG